MSPLSRTISSRLASLLAATGRVRVVDLLSLDGMLPVVRGFLEMELEIAVSSDLDRLKRHFELPTEFEESGYRTLHLGLVHLSTLEVEDARRLLEKASHDGLQYLTTPRSFLTHLLAADDLVLLDDVFLHALTYLREYRYFPDVLQVWADRLRAEGMVEVPTAEFKTLLRRIDRGMIADHTFDRIEDLLRPLAALVGEGIPKQVLADFFRDKDMRRVAIAIDLVPKSEIAIAELHNILLEVHQSSSSATELDREQMLSELRAAGVVLTPQRESALIRDIESRPQPALLPPHDN